MINEKYIVFKRDDWDKWLSWIVTEAYGSPDSWQRGFINGPMNGNPLDEIDDAVVIRHQDIFAAPAFFEYAGQIGTVIELLTSDGSTTLNSPTIVKLQIIRDYFSDQGYLAQQSKIKKLPD